MLGRLEGDIPPPRSRIRMVTPGIIAEEEEEGSICVGVGDGGMKSVRLKIPAGAAEDEGESGETAMVISIGSLSCPVSTVARNAFFKSSVMMYSRWVGTCARVMFGWPLMMTVGRTPYLSSQISETKDSQWRIISEGRRAVSMTPM